MSVPHALLALLADKPKFGLQLRDEFENETGSVWPLNVGQVYTTLQRLERDGLVATEGAEGPQRDFGITADGRAELMTWLRTPSDAPPPRDELVIKMLVALRVPDVNVRELVQLHRRQVVEAMQRFTRQQAEVADDDLAMALALDAQLFRLEGVIRWLDMADARIERSASQVGHGARSVEGAVE